LISVLIAASSVVVRAGLESLARANPSVEVIGTAGLGSELRRKAADLGPDVVLAEVDGQGSELVQSLNGFALVLLSNENALPLLRSGARAVLPQGASEREIGGAIEAVAAGLVAMHPDAFDGPQSEPALTSTSNGPLSNREVEVLRMLSEGLANKEIAYRLSISEHTVKFHVASLFHKLHASSRTEAVTLGVKQGLILL
jgi:DNA-binding NarL/FixJ family response regulator